MPQYRVTLKITDETKCDMVAATEAEAARDAVQAMGGQQDHRSVECVDVHVIQGSD